MVENSSARGQGGTAVLCSAGLDSAVLLADEATKGLVVPLYVSSGLAWEAEERQALARLLDAAPLRGRVAPVRVVEFPLRDLYPSSHWAIRGAPPAFDTPDEDVYLVGRNLVLLTRAGIFCAQNHLPRIVLGVLAGNPFPDATPAFFQAIQSALSLGLDCRIRVDAPYRELGKADVIRLGRSLGVPFELTLSCMNPQGPHHCGQCSKCRERHDAFIEAELEDPTEYASPLPR